MKKGRRILESKGDTIDLQEKRILLYIDRVLGVKFIIVQNLTSEMTEAGG